MGLGRGLQRASVSLLLKELVCRVQSSLSPCLAGMSLLAEA